jgi:two-component system sensor histidine kinase YesM
LAAFIVVVIPVYAAGFGIYRWTINRLQAEIALSQESQSQFYMDKLRSDISRIIKQQSVLLNDKDVMRLAVFPEYETDIDMVFAINRIKDRLASLLDISDIVQNASIHMPGINRSIQANGNVTGLTKEEYEKLVNQTTGSSRQLMHNDGILVTAVASVQIYKGEGIYPTCLSTVELSPGSIKAGLGQIKRASDGGMALLDQQSGQLIAGWGTPAGDPAAVLSLLPVGRSETLSAADSPSADMQTTTELKQWNDVMYLVTVYRDEYIGLTLINYTSAEEIYRPLQRYHPYFWIFTAYVAVVAFLFLYLLYRQVKQPLTQLVEAFQIVESGNLDIKVEYEKDNEFRYLFTAFHSMLGRIRNLIDQVYKQKILYQRSELKQLQSQINPHFLYNSYFVLNDMAVNEDYENLAEFSRQMGIYFQYITRNASSKALLEEEVQHARIYADFQAHRFRNRISMHFEELPEGLRGLTVPRMILQPVIENVFEHGLKNKVRDGLLKIYFQSGNGSLAIIVEDNGDDMSDEELNLLKEKLNSEDLDAESTGLVNIHRRLMLGHGPDSGVEVGRSELGGLKVALRMEKVYNESIDEISN